MASRPPTAEKTLSSNWCRPLGLFLALCCAGGELRAVPETLAEGTRWETPIHVVESAQPGPTVLLTGGVHGDEPAGARAAEQIRHWPIRKGRLVVIPRVNVPGLAAGTRHLPQVPPSQRDLNRNFPRKNGVEDAQGELARSLWCVVREVKPDWLVDLHEGYHFHQIDGKSVGSSIIDANAETSHEVIPHMLDAVNAAITEPDKQFVPLRGSVDGSLARAAHHRLGTAALTLETTTREQPLSLRTRQHRVMVQVLLEHLGMIDRGMPNLVTPPLGGSGLRVALYDSAGASENGPRQLAQVIAPLEGSLVWRVGEADIREGALHQFDLVIFPGGSGSKQAAALGEDGRSHVRNFVEDGGGFVGICAGAYLAAANYKWSLALSNHRTLCEMREVPGGGQVPLWRRGPSSTVMMDLTEEGREILGPLKGAVPVRDHNGPIISPANHEELPRYRVLAYFRSEILAHPVQEGTMVNTPAIIAAEFGAGRVLCISPHPESSKTLRPLLARGIRWVAQKN